MRLSGDNNNNNNDLSLTLNGAVRLALNPEATQRGEVVVCSRPLWDKELREEGWEGFAGSSCASRSDLGKPSPSESRSSVLALASLFSTEDSGRLRSAPAGAPNGSRGASPQRSPRRDSPRSSRGRDDDSKDMDVIWKSPSSNSCLGSQPLLHLHHHASSIGSLGLPGQGNTCCSKSLVLKKRKSSSS